MQLEAVIDQLIDLSLLAPSHLPIINAKREKLLSLKDSSLDDLEDVILEIDRDLVLPGDSKVCKPSIRENSKKRTRDQFEA